MIKTMSKIYESKEKRDNAQDLAFFNDDLNWVEVLATLLSPFRSFQSVAPLYQKHFWPHAVFRKGT